MEQNLKMMEDYRANLLQLKLLKDELSNLDGVSSTGIEAAGSLQGACRNPSDKMIRLVAKRDRIREEIVMQTNACMDAIQETRTILQSIEDPMIRNICYLRHFKGYTWAHSARAVGGKATADSLKKQYERYFKRFVHTAPPEAGAMDETHSGVS